MGDNTWIPPDGMAQENMLHTLLGTRKARRRRDTSAVIWSINLETALLEGLQQYRPTACRDTLMLGRFPGRNQFISDYIWRKTGERRTSKQVGSRLQQLRESPPTQELRNLLFPSPKSIIDGTLAASLNIQVPIPTHKVIVIDILPNWAPEPAPEVPLRPWSESNDVTHVSRYPRRIACIDPTITLVSHTSIFAQSKFTVCTEGGSVHVETHALISMPGLSSFLNCAPLVPGYWNIIVESPDPTRYIIFQEVTLVDDGRIVFSATYNFVYSTQYPMGSGSRADFITRGDVNISY
ncbi:hypothetical protein C8R44DRAFT_990842 [Mycena epipterygia]|nr:hypothetical protein C8R44DRAFT_990842 [Mycena epipterygia]